MDPFDSTQATDADEEEEDFSTMTMGWRLPDPTTTATSTMSRKKTNSTTTATTSWTLRATSFRCKTAIPTTPCRGTRSSWGRLRRQDSEKTWLGGGRKRKNSRVSSEAQAHSEKERTNCVTRRQDFIMVVRASLRKIPFQSPVILELEL